MSFKMLGGGSTLDTVVSDMNQNILELKNREVIEIFKDDTGTRRVVIDSNGVRTSEAGVDVIDATDQQLTFDSSKKVLRIVDEFDLTLSVTASGTRYNSASQSHGLSYVPTFIANVIVPASLGGSNPADKHSNPAIVNTLVAGIFRVLAHCEVTIDATNITIAAQLDGSLGGGPYVFTSHVYLLQENFS